MKYAILSDIHGNVEALKPVVSAAQAEGVDAFVIAGDFMGYYFRTDEVLDILKGLKIISVRGNHEDMFAEWRNSPEKRPVLEKKYGRSFSLNAERLTQEQQESLLTMPVQSEATLHGQSVLVCHGSPWDHDEYVYPDAGPDAIERMFGYQKDILIMGHTHYPALWEKDGKFVINPGSVGQTRDRKGGACWALWDSAEKTVSLRREQYDVSKVIQDCMNFSPETPYLSDVLTRGPAQ